MSTRGASETETVVKRILPYLRRRGYDIESDLTFEIDASIDHKKKFVDIGVSTLKSNKLQFIVEAKRQSHRLNNSDRKQALDYGRNLGLSFVVVTNGDELELLNVATSSDLSLTGSRSGKTMVPHRSQLASVVRKLRANPHIADLSEEDETLPFRPGLPLKQLNALFQRCHNKIRNLEKDEDSAFADFSKFLFLRLLEEKSEDAVSAIDLPYSYRFHDLAARPESKADEVKALITEMIRLCREKYGDVITDNVKLKQARTYAYLVQELAKVSFTDSGLDTKGAAFEYFVRATLKGKKLGQYFTPRALVELMLELVGRDLIVNSVASGDSMKVLDPACGTGGFLVFLMKDSLEEVRRREATRKLSRQASKQMSDRLMSEVFYGMDANSGVASSAKMNMIISGDGHTNIKDSNSLSRDNDVWSFEEGSYDLIITNPPFGTSESDLTAADLAAYEIRSTKGQHLFLQRMVLATKPGGTICTVIDEGVLNTDSAASLRRWIAQRARLRGVVSLPASTFKPNKINVKSSVLVLDRIDEATEDPEAEYDVAFVALDSLGFHPSGEVIRGFPFDRLCSEFRTIWDTVTPNGTTADHWRGFTMSSREVLDDETCRWDFKYWDSRVRDEISRIVDGGGKSIADLNSLETSRGKSPQSTTYVDPEDGYARVVKAGSSLTNFGEVVESIDWVEKATYDTMPANALVQPGDVLLASTGQGTLGKAAVYEDPIAAVADGHVTIIRPNPSEVDPQFLADYLRCGFGRVQSTRLFSGSTGLIEISPDQVDRIVVPTYLSVSEQQRLSTQLREAEQLVVDIRRSSDGQLDQARLEFRGFELDNASVSATESDSEE